jgi:hypothetical protein
VFKALRPLPLCDCAVFPATTRARLSREVCLVVELEIWRLLVVNVAEGVGVDREVVSIMFILVSILGISATEAVETKMSVMSDPPMTCCLQPLFPLPT